VQAILDILYVRSSDWIMTAGNDGVSLADLSPHSPFLTFLLSTCSSHRRITEGSKHPYFTGPRGLSGRQQWVLIQACFRSVFPHVKFFCRCPWRPYPAPLLSLPVAREVRVTGAGATQSTTVDHTSRVHPSVRVFCCLVWPSITMRSRESRISTFPDCMLAYYWLLIRDYARSPPPLLPLPPVFLTCPRAVRAWSAPTGTPVAAILDHTQAVTGLALHVPASLPSAQPAAAAARRRRAATGDGDTGQHARPGVTLPLLLLTASVDGTVRAWNIDRMPFVCMARSVRARATGVAVLCSPFLCCP